LALAAVTIGGTSGTALPFYLGAFFLMGFFNGAAWWSFSAYLLDMASEERRPIYLATAGMLASVTVLNPVIAGALFETVMPEIVFGGASLLAVVGLGLAWTLRSQS
jgi:MFS family permease